jgi:hypothetical protein
MEKLEAKRKAIEDKRTELRKLESDTPMFYLGRLVTVVAETHPSKQLTIRYEDGSTESVPRHLVTDVSPADQAKIDHDQAVEADKVAKEKLDRDVKAGKVAPVKETPKSTVAAKQPQPVPVENKSDHPVKDWFKK